MFNRFQKNRGAFDNIHPNLAWPEGNPWTQQDYDNRTYLKDNVAFQPKWGETCSQSNPDSSDHSNHEDTYHHHEDHYDHANEDLHYGHGNHDLDIPSTNKNEHDHFDHHTHEEEYNKHLDQIKKHDHHAEHSESDALLQIKYFSINFNNESDVNHELSKLSKIKLLGEFANGKYEVVAELSLRTNI